MKKIRINREIWYRGKGPDDSRLLTQQGEMCCMGQICEQLGVSRRRLLNKHTISQLLTRDQFRVILIKSNRSKVPSELITLDDGRIIIDAYVINDDVVTTDAQKEAELIPLLAELGLEVKFYN